MHESIRLRPFHEFVEREPHLSMVEIAARIEGERFVVSAIGHEIVLEAVEVGEDAKGPYALVPESEQTLSNGFKVRVELEHDEILPSGGVISLVFQGEARGAMIEILRAK